LIGLEKLQIEAPGPAGTLRAELSRGLATNLEFVIVSNIGKRIALRERKQRPGGDRGKLVSGFDPEQAKSVAAPTAGS